MRRRPRDLVQIWRYIKNNASLEMADRVESVIREKFGYLAGDRARAYPPETKPLQIVAILHGGRDVEELLMDRLWADWVV